MGDNEWKERNLMELNEDFFCFCMRSCQNIFAKYLKLVW